MITTIVSDPWFSRWNYQLMEGLFHYIPHGRVSDRAFEFLVANPLLSTWFYAAAFYRFWTKADGQQVWRRRLLLQSMVALGIAVLITFVIRPWIGWPAPVLTASFQQLFPRYLWGSGNTNCFPSHSTLTYFIVAAGFWPLNRHLSVGLSALVLLLVSLPRVYVGGHYPIDVLFSCVLGILVLVLVRKCPIPTMISNWIAGWETKAQIFPDYLFFLWTFELGEGFRGVELLASAMRRILRLP